jgi:D-alanyl-D-alanine carboxypeptidase
MAGPVRPAVALVLTLALGAGWVGCTSDEPVAAPAEQGTADVAARDGETGVARIGIDEVDSSVSAVMRAVADDVPGMVVLARVGDDVRVRAEGLADAESGRAMATDDTFPVASITKSMVAAAVMRLVERGRLSPRDPVERWLPGLLPQGDRITIEHLLSHRSGLHEVPWRRITPGMDAEAIVALSGRYPLDFAPGSTSTYSGIGYLALGLLLERIADAPVEEVLETEVFGPAGMTHTRLAGSPTAVSYRGGSPVRRLHLRLAGAAGGVVSTAEDVDRFYQALWSGDLVPPAVAAAMARSTGPLVPGVEYGLGLWRQAVWCGTGVGHSGGGAGVATKAWRLEGTDRSVVVLVNEHDGQSTADELADAALCPPGVE